MLLSYSYPARLQQALLPLDTVLNVYQAQQILLRHRGKEEQSDKERKHLENITRITELSSSLWLFSRLPLFFGTVIIRIRHLCHALFPSERARLFRNVIFSTSASVNVKTIVDSSLLRLYVGNLFELNANRSCVSGSLTAIKSFWPFIE